MRKVPPLGPESRGPRIAAVLFDLDGTLVETRQDIATAVNVLLERHGLAPMSVESIAQHVGRGARVLVTQCLIAAGVPEPSDREIEQAYREFGEVYAQHMLETSFPYPGMKELLVELQRANLPMAVVSNKPEKHSRQVLNGVSMLDFFPVVIGGDSLAKRKPDPAPLLHAWERLGRPEPGAEGCVLVGDSLIDVEAARAVPMRIAAVAWGFSSREELRAAAPDFLAEGPADLGDWILSEAAAAF